MAGTSRQDFHVLKDVQRNDQQQMRKIWAHVGAFHVGLWVPTFIELWIWNRAQGRICDPRDSSWDDPTRSPSRIIGRHCSGGFWSRNRQWRDTGTSSPK